MFENHSSCMWILVILFVVLNCNSCLEDKCEASCGHHNHGCGCDNKQGLFGFGFSPIILIVIFFCFFNNNNNNGFCC